MDSGARILAIDDEESFADILKQYFELRGYEIDVVPDGISGLELFQKKKYDVVLLDLKMVGPNGDEVLKDMRKIDPEVKAIFVTAFNDSGKTKKRLLEQGVYGYIEKPLASLKILQDLIDKAAE